MDYRFSIYVTKHGGMVFKENEQEVVAFRLYLKTQYDAVETLREAGRLSGADLQDKLSFLNRLEEIVRSIDNYKTELAKVGAMVINFYEVTDGVIHKDGRAGKFKSGNQHDIDKAFTDLKQVYDQLQEGMGFVKN